MNNLNNSLSTFLSSVIFSESNLFIRLIEFKQDPESELELELIEGKLESELELELELWLELELELELELGIRNQINK